MDEKTLKLEIQKLVDKFEQVKTKGKYKSYNEENTKKDFIIPLFRALGWNVENSEEVKAEEKVSKKRVDYAFRINGVVKFYLEAKSLKESISEPKYAKQAIEYAWNKSVPWAILCNFEGIRVFNAEWKWDDKQPMRNQFLDLRYTEFLDSCFKYLTWLSRESFEQSVLDKQATILSKKVKKLPIDKQLLADFTNYRKLLSTDILKNNPKMDLSQDNLDEVVQRILDRIIFIRTCEDKEIESEKLESEIRMHGDKEGQLYKELHKKFREYDDGYNSKLFLEHLCEKVIISNDVLKEVISGTYRSKYLDIQYDFSAINADVLGNIYEQYLGHILKKTPQRAKLTNGKAHRKEQGIYYTPTNIVDYIVRNTIGEKLKERKLNIDELRILDPACGSGSFLLKAFDVICEHEMKKEGDTLQARFEDVSSGKLLKRKTELLKNCIFGVDLDTQAVEITQLNLLLKLAEKRQQLPTLQENIKCGNSLIDDPNVGGDKAFTWEEQFKEIMDEEKFDVIIGNPPYVTIGGKEDANITEEVKNYYLENYKSYEYKANYFILFVEKSISLLKNGGYLSFIVPRTLLDNTHMKNLRKIILDNVKIKTLIELKYHVFEGAEIGGNLIFVIEKCNNERERYNNTVNCLLISDKHNNLNELKYNKIKQSYFSKSDIFQFFISDASTIALIENIKKETKKLSEICLINNGVNTGNAAKILLSNKKETELYRKILEGKDINRYFIQWNGLWVNYDPSLKNRIDLRELDTRQKKIDFSLRNEDLFNSEKIILRQTADRLIGTFDNEKYITRHSTHLIRMKDEGVSIKYILGLFNSKLLTYYYRNLIPEKGKVFAEVKTVNVEKLPIKLVPDSQQQPIIKLVDKMLSLNKRLNEIGDKQTDERARIVEDIKKIDNEIDQMVYKLYGLTKEEIAIVEESGGKT